MVHFTTEKNKNTKRPMKSLVIKVYPEGIICSLINII